MLLILGIHIIGDRYWKIPEDIKYIGIGVHPMRSEHIVRWISILVPGMAYLVLFFILISILEKIKHKIDIKIKRIKRTRKIKLGLIKISPNDPYGEENWED